ncbi:MAG: ribosome maturation factor RimP [Hyphomicrobiaceae bacterium]
MSEPTSDWRFIAESGKAAEIAELAEPVLESLGFRIVMVRVIGGAGPIVEIMAERPDGSMSIEDCKAVSQNLSPVLDVHDPMPESSYRLQVSSPGIDRPLVRPSDFDTWAGYEAKIEMKELISGRRRFRGVLEGFEAGEVRIEVEIAGAGRQVLGLPVDMVAEAKLVLTDELVRESLRRAKRARSTPVTDASTGDTAEAPTTARNAKDVKPSKAHTDKVRHVKAKTTKTEISSEPGAAPANRRARREASAQRKG